MHGPLTKVLDLKKNVFIPKVEFLCLCTMRFCGILIVNCVVDILRFGPYYAYRKLTL